MKQRTFAGIIGTGAALSIGGIFIATAGDLNPPAGAVAPTMTTLDDILDAINGPVTFGGSGVFYMQMTGVDGEVDGQNGIPDDSIEVFGYGFNASNIPAKGATPSLGAIDVSLGQSKATPQIFQRLATGTMVTSVILQQYTELPDPELVAELQLENVFVTKIQTATDGLRGTSTLSLVPETLCVRSGLYDPGKGTSTFTSYCWDFLTNSSCGSCF